MIAKPLGEDFNFCWLRFQSNIGCKAGKTDGEASSVDKGKKMSYPLANFSQIKGFSPIFQLPNGQLLMVDFS